MPSLGQNGGMGVPEDSFSNVYADRARAEAYATLEFPGTYYLAFRDLPAIIGEHVRGRRAIDFGCGAGRSTRFLRKLGFDVVGLDVSEPMLARARERDPEGDYRLVPDGDLGGLAAGTFDLVLSAFTFDNIPTMEKKVAILQGLKHRLGPERADREPGVVPGDLRERVGLVFDEGLSREPGRSMRRQGPDRHARRRGQATRGGHPLDR